MTQKQIVDALNALRPGAQWFINTPDLSGLVWLDSAQSRPSDSEILARIPQ